jgi:hypothetical protein
MNDLQNRLFNTGSTGEIVEYLLDNSPLAYAVANRLSLDGLRSRNKALSDTESLAKLALVLYAQLEAERKQYMASYRPPAVIMAVPDESQAKLPATLGEALDMAERKDPALRRRLHVGMAGITAMASMMAQEPQGLSALQIEPQDDKPADEPTRRYDSLLNDDERTQVVNWLAGQDDKYSGKPVTIPKATILDETPPPFYPRGRLTKC